MINPKICLVTGTRADYGLLRPLIEGINSSNLLELQRRLLACISPEFGMTLQDIYDDGYHVNRKVEMLLGSDTPEVLINQLVLD